MFHMLIHSKGPLIKALKMSFLAAQHLVIEKLFPHKIKNLKGHNLNKTANTFLFISVLKLFLFYCKKTKMIHLS